MRRIVLGAAALAALTSGCRTVGPTPGAARPRASDRTGAAAPEGTAPAPSEGAALATPARLFDRTAVPDAVMLRGQAEAGYRDSPIP